MTIKKLSRKEFNEKRSRFETELQNGDRDIVTPILDKMDTFTAFSYLFRRFGTPTFNADNESNNLFEYAFLVNGVLITIHGSYKTFVYVRAYISKEALDGFEQKVYSFLKNLVKRLHAEGIPFVQGLVLPQDAVPKDKSQENVRLWHEKASSYIIPVPDEVIGSFGFENDGDQERVRTFVREKVMPQLKHIPGLPFIKNGIFSDKFQFKTCCPDSADEDTITKCISDIQYDALDKLTGGYAEIVLRERIESPGYMPRIYGGMPLNTEFRVFYDFDRKQALYAANYWDRDYCRNAIAGRSEEDGKAYDLRYPSLLAEFEANRPDVLHKAHSALREADGLTGIWSVDFLLDSRGRLWLIDMAVGYRSAYWDPARATAVRNQAETKLYLDGNDPAGQPDIAVWVRELFRCAREDGREFIGLSNRAVVNAWEKTHPETALPKEEPERSIVFIDTVNPGAEPEMRKFLNTISRHHHAFESILEVLTGVACEKLVNGNAS